MSVVCASCGQENPAGFRFCGACGASLTEAPAAREERKVVSVLFCDLVGSTARAEHADPEDVRAFLSSYHDRVRSELERFGGTVEKFIGDAVMALFGAPVAHEDDPERAVRAALAIRDWANNEQTVQVRIGITTGEALVTVGARPSLGEAMASGDVVNTAARLQTNAPVNGILADETTYRATRDVIRFDERDAVEAKGKSGSVRVWEAAEARSRLGVDVVRTARTELVGRARELDVLQDALTRVRAERQPQLVSLVGVPGIGKSRLVYELLRVVEEDDEIIYWRQGRSLPYGEGVSYWALAEVVKAQAGILETDTAQDAGAKLMEAVASVLDEDDRTWVEQHLRALVGLGGELDVGGDRRAEAFAAWRRLFEAMATRSPFVLVFEDLQWADDGMLDFVDHLVDWATGVPLLVVVAARPELLSRRPGWGGGKPNATTLSLGPLSDDETALLIGRLLGRAVLPAETQVELLARAGGNPLYAEQFTRLLEEHGAGAELTLPETVQGIIAARLDGLAPDEKELLQDAAVVGKVFWRGALAAIGNREPWAVEQSLHGLERRDFVRRHQRSSVAAENEHAFLHLLVRDVAYGQIPRAARSEKHRLAAEWIESLSTDRTDDRAELLAHHYSSALEYAVASGQETSALTERARLALREAADRSTSLFAYADASRHYSAALELWPTDDPERPRIQFAHARAYNLAEGGGAELLADARDRLLAAGDPARAGAAEITIAEVHWMRGDLGRSEEHQQRARELVESTPPSTWKAFVLSNVARFRMLATQDEDATRIGREALAMAEDLGLDSIRAHALNNIGSARFHAGDLGGLADLEQSIQISTTADPSECMRGYGNLGTMQGEYGDLARHAECMRRALAIAERLAVADGIRWFRGEQITSMFWAGRWDEALELANELIAESEREPFYTEAGWRVFRGRIRLARGDVEGAIDDALKGVGLARRANDPQVADPVFVFAARALLDAGRRAEADRMIDELDVAGRPIVVSVSGWSVDMPSVLVELGRADELVTAATQIAAPTRWMEAIDAYVRGDLVTAADVYADIGSVVDEAFTRLRAAEQLVAAGRRTEADVELTRARAFWQSVGATRYVGECEALLAASA